MLDQMGSYMHQLKEVPGQEEAVLDIRFEDLQLTPQQLRMAMPPEARLKTFPQVRHGVVARMDTRKRMLGHPGPKHQ